MTKYARLLAAPRLLLARRRVLFERRMHPGGEVQSQSLEYEKHAAPLLPPCKFYSIQRDVVVFNLHVRHDSPHRIFGRAVLPAPLWKWKV